MLLEQQADIVPRKPLYRRIFRFFFWSAGIFLFLVIAGVCLVMAFEDEVKSIAVKELNKKLRTEVRIDPRDIDLTFISSFPKCAIRFSHITAMEALKKKDRDTLFYAGELSLLFNIKDLFNKKYIVKNLQLKDGWCFPQVDKAGKENYLVWETTGDAADTVSSSDSLQFRLDDISISNFRFKYKNAQRKIRTDLVIKKLDFSGNFSESNYRMEARGEMLVHKVQVQKTTYVNEKSLKLNLGMNVSGNKYEIKKSELKLNEMNFAVDGNFNYRDSLNNMQLSYKAQNLNIAAIFSLLPEKYTSRVNDYKSAGEFFAEGKLNYNARQPLEIQTAFGIRKAEIEYSKASSKLSDVVLDGELMMSKSNSFLNLKSISANLNGEAFTGSFMMKDFNDPYIELSANGSFNLRKVNEFWPIDTLQSLEGNLKINGELKGMLNEFRSNTFSEKISVNLAMEVEKLKARFRKDESDFAIESGRITAKERDIRVDNFRLLRGKSDVDLSGEIPGMFNYILNSKAPLVIKGELNSRNFIMEDFIFSSSQGQSSKTEEGGSEFHVPENVQLYLDANIGNFKFGKFEASNIKGNFELKNQKAMISDTRFETMEGSGVVDALADASGKHLDLNLEADVKHINVKKLFYGFNNFGQSTLLDKNINGYLTASIEFSGRWDRHLHPDLNSVIATVDLNIEGGELNDFKPLESLSRFIELNELQKIKFSNLSSRLEIKNSAIYIPQTTIKNSALNIDFNGVHSFNNDIDYHIRLLISELLAKKRKHKDDEEFGPVENDPGNRRSAYILMTGNIDNIQIKYDKQGMRQKIKEDIKQERQNLKQILKEEFGSFKKDSANARNSKAEQKWELEKPDNKPKKKTLEPKKKKEDDDDF
jgi:hypothetical protein